MVFFRKEFGARGQISVAMVVRYVFCRASVLLVALFAVVRIGFAQATEILRPPDAVIVVTKHPMGADIFRVRMLKPGYSTETLTKQVAAFGQAIGSVPRGLEVTGVKISSKDEALTATAYFAVDGFADASAGTFRIEPLVKAFVSIPGNPPVSMVDVLVQDISPTARTLRAFESDAVKLESLDMGNGAGTEIRVLVKTDRAEDIRIPGDATEVVTPLKKKPADKPAPNPGVWLVLALGLLGGGALVYFGVSANRTRPRS
jgi:hypothetical protein